MGDLFGLDLEFDGEGNVTGFTTDDGIIRVRQAGDGVEFIHEPPLAIDEVLGVEIRVGRVVLAGDGSVRAANLEIGAIRSGAIPDALERGAVGRFLDSRPGLGQKAVALSQATFRFLTAAQRFQNSLNQLGPRSRGL